MIVLNRACSIGATTLSSVSSSSLLKVMRKYGNGVMGSSLRSANLQKFNLKNNRRNTLSHHNQYNNNYISNSGVRAFSTACSFTRSNTTNFINHDNDSSSMMENELEGLADQLPYQQHELQQHQMGVYYEKTFVVNSVEDTRKLAEKFSPMLDTTDVLLLIGDMGSGKSVFARHIIRVLEKNMELSVPSPTFLLDNIYECKLGNRSIPVHHIDLYRLDRFDRLDLPSVFTSGISLIEWGNRLLEDEVMNKPHHSYIRESMFDTSKCHILCIIFEPVDLEISDDQDENRIITFHSNDSLWKERLEKLSKMVSNGTKSTE